MRENSAARDAKYPRLYAEQLTATVAESCGGLLVASYLHGSAALGGWNAQRSDVDILFVARDGITDDTIQAVASVLLHAGADCPGRGLEVSLVTAGQAAKPREPWPFGLHLTSGAGRQRVTLGSGLPGDPDLIMHYAACRAAGITLFGPKPQEVIGAVPRPVILGYLATDLEWGLDNAAESYGVLNACRAAEFLDTGRFVSKVAGGAAAIDRHAAPVGLVRRALDQQRALEPERPPGPDAIAFVRRVGARLAAAASREQAG
jgi:hypothetical protein